MLAGVRCAPGRAGDPWPWRRAAPCCSSPCRRRYRFGTTFREPRPHPPRCPVELLRFAPQRGAGERLHGHEGGFRVPRLDYDAGPRSHHGGMRTQNAISAQRLLKSYGDHSVLDDIDLEVPTETVFALLRLIADLHHLDRASVGNARPNPRRNDHRAPRLPDHRRLRGLGKKRLAGLLAGGANAHDLRGCVEILRLAPTYQ